MARNLNRVLVIGGVSRTVREWANLHNIGPTVLYERVYAEKVDPVEALKPAQCNGSWQSRGRSKSSWFR
ncbi:MAG: hypothetical protein E6Q76_14365 [Rhizobium sp.]|nr:MAG: hypothetical protein E6Q76_14365 [Rhizobium sp.]